MKTREELGYDVHVLVCVNERPSRSCCANVAGGDIFLALKRWVAESGLTRRVWVTKTGCLGFCNDTGANVVLYPAGHWFLHTTSANTNVVVEEIRRQLLAR